MHLCKTQECVDPLERDYGYVEYLQKSAKKSNHDPISKELEIGKLKYHEARRDYFTASLRPINHLIQIDQKPNLELMEPKSELYKISISLLIGKFFKTDFIIGLTQR